MEKRKFKPGDRVAVIVEAVESLSAIGYSITSSELGSFTLPPWQTCPAKDDLIVVEYVGPCWDPRCEEDDGWRIVEDE